MLSIGPPSSLCVLKPTAAYEGVLLGLPGLFCIPCKSPIATQATWKAYTRCYVLYHGNGWLNFSSIVSIGLFVREAQN